MESLLGLIGKFLEYVTSWLPRPVLIAITQRGVRFRLGYPAKIMKPGLHLQVPLFSSVKIYEIVLCATEFEPCVLMTKDLKPILVGFVLFYWIEDPILAATTVDDIVQTIGEIGESFLPKTVMEHTLEELRDAMVGRSPLLTMLTNEAKKVLKEYGVGVKYVRINNLSPCRAFKLSQR